MIGPPNQTPDIPKFPLDVIQIELYFINNKTMLILKNNQTKFASAFTIVARDAISITRTLKTY